MEFILEALILLVPAMLLNLILASQSLAHFVASQQLNEHDIAMLIKKIKPKILQNIIGQVGYSTQDINAYLVKANTRYARQGQLISIFLVNLIIVALIYSAFQFDVLERRILFMIIAVFIGGVEILALRFGHNI